MYYSIRVKGYLDRAWSEWFDGMTINYLDCGETVLCGLIPDQAALHGLIVKVRDLGLPLITVAPLEPAPGFPCPPCSPPLSALPGQPDIE